MSFCDVVKETNITGMNTSRNRGQCRFDAVQGFFQNVPASLSAIDGPADLAPVHIVSTELTTKRWSASVYYVAACKPCQIKEYISVNARKTKPMPG